MQRVTNHPVHLVDDNGNLSPTALIPFCAVSNNFSTFGVKIEQFDTPVCKMFRPKNVRDQLCYTADLNQIKDKSLKGKLFFTFFIHMNKDRELSSITTEERDNFIIIDSIGKNFTSIKLMNDLYLTIPPDPLHLSLENEYNLNVLKEIEVSDDFLTIDENVRNCQNDETYDDCITEKYVHTILKNCRCIALNFGLFNKVFYI